MMRCKNKIRALTVCTLFAAANCHAVDLHVGGELINFNYVETDIDGSRLNKETGYIPGVSSAALRLYRGINHNLEHSFYGSDVDYDGQTRTGIHHKTRRNNASTARSSGSAVPWKSRMPMFLARSTGSGDRDIQPGNGVLGLFERYEW